MTANEIREELEKVETYIFMATMADFMDWANYNRLQARKRNLKEMLEKVES